MCEIYQVPALQEEKGCLVQEKPLGHLSAPPGDLRVSPEASSWHTLLVYLPAASPMVQTSWLPIISQTRWAFSDQVVSPLWKSPPPPAPLFSFTLEGSTHPFFKASIKCFIFLEAFSAPPFRGPPSSMEKSLPLICLLLTAFTTFIQQKSTCSAHRTLCWAPEMWQWEMECVCVRWGLGGCGVGWALNTQSHK